MKLTGRICQLVVCLTLWLGVCSRGVAQQPAAQAPAPVPAPAPVQQPEPENIERMLSFGLYDWLPSGGPRLTGGTLAVEPPSHSLRLPTKPFRSYGAMVTFPTKGSSRLEISYLTLNDRGNALAPTDLGFFGGTVPTKEPLSLDYSLRHLKVSWNYLSYPNPPQDSKFRLKTLWEVHFLQVTPTVVETVTAPDLPLSEKQRIILPAVGLGIEYVPSKHFRMELKASGMGFPKRASLGDGEGTAVVRLGSLEIFAGMKALYFRTSPKKETYVTGTLWGPYGGLRWVFR